jgi:ketosteroid isomerase-like protein
VKKILLTLLLSTAAGSFSLAQSYALTENQRQDIHALINHYSQARETGDTVLLKSILTPDIDQLVSTGEWRNGINASMKGMQSSSANSPGKRSLSIEKIRLITKSSAIVDCKYEIQNTDGTPRKMWSTFVVISDKKNWKISAIRNMLPGGQ